MLLVVAAVSVAVLFELKLLPDSVCAVSQLLFSPEGSPAPVSGTDNHSHSLMPG